MHDNRATPMPLHPGASFGLYEVLAPLGAGGMGEVYRARDPKLKREVAIKVLPDALARDPERLARFEREAQVLASLNHPHIAAIYGVESGRRARRSSWSWSRGRRSPIASRGARFRSTRRWPIARQIAEALDAAHEARHRPSRSQARQHQGRGRRHGEGAGLRAGEGDRRAVGASSTNARSRRRSRRWRPGRA